MGLEERRAPKSVLEEIRRVNKLQPAALVYLYMKSVEGLMCGGDVLGGFGEEVLLTPGEAVEKLQDQMGGVRAYEHNPPLMAVFLYKTLKGYWGIAEKDIGRFMSEGTVHAAEILLRGSWLRENCHLSEEDVRNFIVEGTVEAVEVLLEKDRQKERSDWDDPKRDFLREATNLSIENLMQSKLGEQEKEAHRQLYNEAYNQLVELSIRCQDGETGKDQSEDIEITGVEQEDVVEEGGLKRITRRQDKGGINSISLMTKEEERGFWRILIVSIHKEREWAHIEVGAVNSKGRVVAYIYGLDGIRQKEFESFDGQESFDYQERREGWLRLGLIDEVDLPERINLAAAFEGINHLLNDNVFDSRAYQTVLQGNSEPVE